MIYLDHNATTPVDERVVEAMLPFLTRFYANPSSLYRMGRLVRSAIETAREQVAALAGAQPEQIIFTSGGTEANNLIISNIAPHSHVAASAIEHPSLVQPLKNKEKDFSSLNWWPVDQSGVLDVEYLDSQSLCNIDFVSVMLANNETGVIQDLSKLIARCQEHNAFVHTDAVQALGKMSFSFADSGIDAMSLSSHKINGPKGCGALVMKDYSRLSPLLAGGGQEKGIRSGTENVPAIIGFGKAAELAAHTLPQNQQNMVLMRDYLEACLVEQGVRVLSAATQRIPNTTMFCIDGVDGEMLQMQLDKKGIAVSSGSACSSGGGEPSPVLLAMGFDPISAKSAIRVSLGKENTRQDVDKFLQAFFEVIGLGKV